MALAVAGFQLPAADLPPRKCHGHFNTAGICGPLSRWEIAKKLLTMIIDFN